MIDYNSNSKN